MALFQVRQMLVAVVAVLVDMRCTVTGTGGDR
jgi:hypothetical protein